MVVDGIVSGGIMAAFSVENAEYNIMDGKRRGRAGLLNNGKLRWSLYRSRATAANKYLPPSSTTTTVLHLPYPTATHDQPGGYMKMLNQPEHLRPPHQSYNKITLNQDHQLTPQLPIHTRSVPCYPSTPDITKNTAVDSYSAAKMDTLYGGAVDDAVDLKAANYISSVREKFRLDYLN
nr:hypothetical protein MIMGU_mgv1a016151mg [Ipomoea batatas]